MRLVVLGDPVDHSLSPDLHNAALRTTGLIGSYERRRVDAAGMAAAVEDIRQGRLDGANVTMPHKALAAELADRLAVSAEKAGAVNTLVRVAGHAVGHNTDIAGIHAAWREAGLPDGPVLVLGAGGAAAAALIALEEMPLSLSSRRPEKARELIAQTGIAASVMAWGSSLQDAVVVNATPLGMEGETLPPGVLDEACGLFDMAYGRQSTPAVEAMRQGGRPVADGPAMLLHQAAAAFELWTGHRAPLEAMRQALEA